MDISAIAIYELTQQKPKIMTLKGNQIDYTNLYIPIQLAP